MKTLLKTNHIEVIEVRGKEMIKRPIACAILAFDGLNVIMVEQQRGTFGKVLEVPAGKVEFNEDPMVTAIRELEEETGYGVLNCSPLISYFPSVGYSTEVINCYYSSKLSKRVKPQRLDDNERVKVKKINFGKLIDMINNGEIKDSKTIMCVWSYLLKEKKLGV
jgi:ADP-ribose pyrophosphatase